jgi:Zn-dependent M28 family amino/carboxypeptidase
MMQVMLHDQMFANDPMRADRPDWGQMRSSAAPIIQVVPEQVRLTLHGVEREVERITVPNVVGRIPGSDPTLAAEYVVYSAHMDHVGTAGDGVGGCTAMPAQGGQPADSICNGADDDASGSIAVLSIAEAYSRLSVKPRRSIIVLHVSGEEKGLLGSEWYAEHPTVPASQIVANINMDMVGRNNPDSIVVIGKEHSDMGQTLARVNARHPELRLTTSDDLWPNERFYFRSDHYNFARKGVPILFFFNGTHPQYHRPNDHVELIDEDKLSRVAKVAFYLGAEIANTATKPQWNPESYRTIVEGPGR